MNEKTERTEELITGMIDAGCTQDEIKSAERLINADCFEDLPKHLKKCRAVLMDKMHESQKRVDRMDYLIRQSEKFLAK